MSDYLYFIPTKEDTVTLIGLLFRKSKMDVLVSDYKKNRMVRSVQKTIRGRYLHYSERFGSGLAYHAKKDEYVMVISVDGDDSSPAFIFGQKNAEEAAALGKKADAKPFDLTQDEISIISKVTAVSATGIENLTQDNDLIPQVFVHVDDEIAEAAKEAYPDLNIRE
jgi:hypothetical protein